VVSGNLPFTPESHDRAAALNEGRALFPSDEQFGQWIEDNVPRQLAGAKLEDHDRTAAMWAADNPEQFQLAKETGKARTIRGVHAKWSVPGWDTRGRAIQSLI